MIREAFTRPPARTYGTLTYSPPDEKLKEILGRWQIKAEPHVTMEIKRLLPGYQQKFDGTLTYTDTPETAFKIAWLMIMYPLERDAATERHLDARTTERVRKIETVESILNSGTATLGEGAFESAIPLKPHQIEAAAIATTTGALLLLDETGAMKTAASIATIANPKMLPALVVAPPHLQLQWMREINRFFPMLRSHIIATGKVYDPAAAKGMHGHDPDVLICSYHKLTGWADHLAGKVRSVVLEEGHEIRRTGTQKYTAAGQVARDAAVRLAVTATPVFNWGDEIFNILDVIAPGALGARQEFYAEWCMPAGAGKYKVKDPAALGSHLRGMGIALKRTLKQIGVNLPGLIPVPFELDVEGDAFDRLAADAVSLAEQIVERRGKPFELMRAAGEFDMKMRQATGTAKAPHVAALCKMLLADPEVEKLLLFGWHRDVYDVWLRELVEFHPAMYTGSESVPQKEISRIRFMGGEELDRLRDQKTNPDGSTIRESRILIVSLRSGAGLDGLQAHCHTAVHGELDWSPAPHVQGDGRLKRPGQDRPVLSYRPYCDYGTDPLMLQRLAEKREQAEGITEPSGQIFEPSNAEPDAIRKVAEAFLNRVGGTPRKQRRQEHHQTLLDIAA